MFGIDLLGLGFLQAIAIAFFGGGSFVAVIEFIKWLINRKSNARTERFGRVLERIDKVYDTINIVLSRTPADRVIVCRAEDSGDIPRLGTPLYSSVVYEVYDEPIGSGKQDWTRRELDASYIRLLMQVVQNEHVHLNKEDLLEGSIIYNLYESHGLLCSDIYLIKKAPGVLIYLSVDYPVEDKDGIPVEHKDTQTPQHRNTLDAAAARLRALFDEDYEELARVNKD